MASFPHISGLAALEFIQIRKKCWQSCQLVQHEQGYRNKYDIIDHGPEKTLLCTGGPPLVRSLLVRIPLVRIFKKIPKIQVVRF